MSKSLERRQKLRNDLIQAAERLIAERGLTGLKTRELAREIGCANGAVYNLVADVDELILRVGSRTLHRLDEALSAAEHAGEPSPQETLVRIAIAYCDFAAENLQLWRALFEHRMDADKTVPDWSIDDQMQLFRHIHQPLGLLLPKRSPEQLGITARSLFSAVHGMVALGLERKLVAVPLPALRSEIADLVRAMLDGLVARETAKPGDGSETGGI